MAELKKCPFCGNEPELVDNRLGWYVRCECGCTVVGKRAPEPNCEKSDDYWQKFEQDAVDRWNRRDG